jgi:phage tail-like protein
VPDELLRSFRFQVKLLSPLTRLSSGANEAGESLPTGQQLGSGAFQECTGLEVEMDVQEIQEGGRNDGTIRRVGRAKYQNIVLKRGMFYDAPGPEDPGKREPGTPPPVQPANGGPVNPTLWTWLQDAVSGKTVARYDGIVEVMSVGDHVVARWVFDRGLPAKVVGPQLNGRTGEVAIEEIHIAHEGLRLRPAL